MNKKIMTLLALAAFSNANARTPDTMASGCAPEAPWAMHNNVLLFGASVGVASMKDPISTEIELTPPELTIAGSGIGTTTQDMTILTPMGYSSDIDTLVPSAAKMGFSGRLDVQYGMRQGMFGMFLYAGIGLNQAKTSAQAIASNAYKYNDSYQIDTNVDTTQDTTFDSNETVVSTAAFTEGPTENPVVTITSGLNFQAGARMGVWVNNMFFHGIVGWQCLNLQSKVSNVYEAFTRETSPVDASVTPVTFTSDFETLGQLTSFTKNKWTNALVLGAGIDFAHQKWTYGFYYQAAICQRTKFKYNNFVVGATANELSGDTGDSMTFTQTYGASPVTVSIQPVISTFMMTVKYAFHKA